jgi:hypothetical protein
MSLLFLGLWQRYWDSGVLAALLFCAWRWPFLADSLIRPIEELGARLARRRNTAIIGIVLFVAICRASLLPFFPIRPPAIHDEYGYLLGADTFSHGRLTNPAHPMWIYFDTFEEIQQPTYASMLPPAQSAFLALGQILGQPWIGVLISMALMFGALLWMLQGWFPPQWALLGTMLLFFRIGLFSYWMNTYWGGAVATLASCVLFGSLPRILRHRKPVYSTILGLGAALLLNARPYEGFFVFLAISTYLAVWALKKRTEWKSILPQVIVPIIAVTLLCGAFVAYYNFRVTENAFLFPHVLSDRQYLSISPFAWVQLESPRLYANKQFDIMYNHWARNIYKPGWDDFVRVTKAKIQDFSGFFIGSALAVPFLAFPWILHDRRMRVFFLVCIYYFPATVIVVWFLPHYAAPVLPVLFAFIVQMLRHLRRWSSQNRLIGIGMTRAIVLSALIFFGWSALFILRHPRGELVLGSGYEPSWERQKVLDRLNDTPGMHLVIVRYSEHHSVHHDWVFNGADIDNSKVVWAREIPEIGMQPLLDYFKNRRIWLVTPDDDPERLQPYAPLSESAAAAAINTRP